MDWSSLAAASAGGDTAAAEELKTQLFPFIHSLSLARLAAPDAFALRQTLVSAAAAQWAQAPHLTLSDILQTYRRQVDATVATTEQQPLASVNAHQASAPQRELLLLRLAEGLSGEECQEAFADDGTPFEKHFSAAFERYFASAGVALSNHDSAYLWSFAGSPSPDIAKTELAWSRLRADAAAVPEAGPPAQVAAMGRRDAAPEDTATTNAAALPLPGPFEHAVATEHSVVTQHASDLPAVAQFAAVLPVDLGARPGPSVSRPSGLGTRQLREQDQSQKLELTPPEVVAIVPRVFVDETLPTSSPLVVAAAAVEETPLMAQPLSSLEGDWVTGPPATAPAWTQWQGAIGFLAAAVLLLAAMGVSSVLFYRTERSLQNEKPLIEVWVAAVDLPEGALLRDDFVARRKIPSDFKSEAALVPGKGAQPWNQRVLVNLQAGDPILLSQVEGAQQAPRLSNRITNALRVVSIATTETQSVGQFVRVGDSVDILASVNVKERPLSTTFLQAVTVVAIGGPRYSVEAKPKKKGRRGLPYQHVSLLVTAAEAEVLSLAQEQGTVSLTMRGTDDPDLEPPRPALGLKPALSTELARAREQKRNALLEKVRTPQSAQ